jgi:hypothetical protein
MAAKVDRDQPEGFGEGALGVEEAAIGHQPVKKHQRPALALVLICDPSAVRCRENLQNILQGGSLPPESLAGRSLALN